MLEMCMSSGKSIAELKSENEQANISRSELSQGINKIWDVMNNCIEEGLKKKAYCLVDYLLSEELKVFMNL